MRQRVKSTSIEQSRKLLELGFDPNSADMHFHYKETKIEALRWELLPYGMTTKENYSLRIERLNVGGLWKHKDGTPMSGEEVFEKMYGNDVPSWSAEALANMLPESIDSLGVLEISRKNGGWCVCWAKGCDVVPAFYGSFLESVYEAICFIIEANFVKINELMKEIEK